jgi:hypothetical protein
MRTILLISPYWKEPHRWMVSTVKLAELWQRLGYRVIVACMGEMPEANDQIPNPKSQIPNPNYQFFSSNSSQPHVSVRADHVEHVSETLTIYRKKDYFSEGSVEHRIALGFSRDGPADRPGGAARCDRGEQGALLDVTQFALASPARTSRAAAHGCAGGDDVVAAGASAAIAARLHAWTLGWLILRCAHRVVFFHPQPERLLKPTGHCTDRAGDSDGD